MKLTDKESNDLQREIDHILDSGANSVRLLNMIDLFLFRRDKENTKDFDFKTYFTSGFTIDFYPQVNIPKGRGMLLYNPEDETKPTDIMRKQ